MRILHARHPVPLQFCSVRETDADTNASSPYGPGRDMLSALDDYLVEQLKKDGISLGETLRASCCGCQDTVTAPYPFDADPGVAETTHTDASEASRWSAGPNFDEHAFNDSTMSTVTPREDQEFDEEAGTGYHMDSDSRKTQPKHRIAAASVQEPAFHTNAAFQCQGDAASPDPAIPQSSHSSSLNASNAAELNELQSSNLSTTLRNPDCIQYTPICKEPLESRR